MTAKLDNALGLYMRGIRDGEPRAALEAHTGHRYTQHSTGVGDGREGFIAFFERFLARNPKRDIRVLRAIEDGRNVFCHVFQSLNDGESRWVTMDMFDTDADDRIIEHWDVISAYAPETASGADMIDGPSEPGDPGAAAANKETVLEYVKQVRQGGHLDRLENFVADDLIQRHPEIAAGGAGLRDHLASGADGAYEMLFKLLGQGDLVVTYGKRHKDGADFADFDLYRLAGGLIVEQWTCSEQILDRSQWGNSGKF